MTFAIPFVQPAAPTLRTGTTPPCVGCGNKAGEIAYKEDRIRTLEREATELREQITDLRAQVNATPPTDREFADLRARMHRLADEEAKARRGLADTRNELQEALGKLARAERTVRNLHVRFERLGLTP